MENKEYMAVAGVFVLVASLFGYVILTEDQVYFCEDTKLVGYCNSLSKINSNGFQTRCYYNDSAPTKYKNCKTGWNSFTQEIVVEPRALLPGSFVQEKCDVEKCVLIN